MSNSPDTAVQVHLFRATERARNRLVGGALVLVLIALGGIVLSRTVARIILAIKIEKYQLELRSPRGEVRIHQVLDESPPQLRVYFTVRDSRGNLAGSLTRKDVRLSQVSAGPIRDFEMAPAGDEPIRVILAMDTSSSMRDEERLDQSREAARLFLANFGKGEVALVSFSRRRTLHQDFTSNLRLIDRRLGDLEARGETVLNDAVLYCARKMKDLRGRKAIVLLTDGSDTASRHPMPEAIEAARASSVPVFTIGLGPGIRSDVLGRLARETGGEFFHARDAYSLGDLYTLIAQRLGQQFVVTFDSLITPPGVSYLWAVLALVVVVVTALLWVLLKRRLRRPEILFLGGPREGTHVRLVHGVTLAGRDPSCELVLDGDDHIAPRQFVIEETPGGYMLESLEGAGTVTVNHLPVHACRLESGDVIRAGRLRLMFFQYGAEAPDELMERDRPLRPPPPRWWLISEEMSEAHELSEDRVRIGREPDTDIVLDDPSVSRRHADLVRVEGGYELVDHQSRNGSYVGGRRVDGRMMLAPGDRVRFGVKTFRVSDRPPGVEDWDEDEPREDELSTWLTGGSAGGGDVGVSAPPSTHGSSRGLGKAAPETGRKKFCTRCGGALKPTSRFCSACGTKVAR